MFTDIEDILIELDDKKLTKRVHSTLHKYQDRIKSLKSLDKKHRIYFLDLLLEKTKTIIKKRKFDKRIESFLLNKIQGLYRNEINIKIQQIVED